MKCLVCGLTHQPCIHRPIDKKLRKRSKLPSVKKLWSVEEKLGGWDKAQTKFFNANVRPLLLLLEILGVLAGSCCFHHATGACDVDSLGTCIQLLELKQLAVHPANAAAQSRAVKGFCSLHAPIVTEVEFIMSALQGILDGIQRHVGEVRLRQREEQKRQRR